ncbi:MAG: NUDIX domain-containing protein [Bacteroidales bacterium]|nr:NUDIX domain-containing protein [Bacteroidales bacterium]
MIPGLAYPPTPAPLYPRPSIARPGRQRRPKGELLPLIEPSGLVYGQATREWCHSGVKALHPVVHLHIIDRFGEVYLQKRSVVKDLFPGYWDTAVGGHVSYGESVEEALYREAAEELGLHAFYPTLLETYTWETELDNEFVFVFATVGHPDLHPDHGEVSTGRWWKRPDLEALFGGGTVTPNFEYEFALIRERLFALL